MKPHEGSWDPVIRKVQEILGPRFDPKRRGKYQDGLLRILVRELPQFDQKVISKAALDAIRQFKIAVDWTRVFCALLTRLPGWWTKLANNPGFDASTMLLLTDGTVMVQEQGGLNWKKLTPDGTGSYVNGTWSDLAPMKNTRRYYASAVLKDGRVFVSGGEYSDAGGETTATEIYDPVSDTWTQLTPPPGWAQVGDAACAVLPDGTVLLGSIGTTKTAIYDPVADTWTAGPTKGSSSSEESWVLLPDDTVVTVQCNNTNHAEKYVAASNSWVSAGTVPVGLVEVASSEIGAGVLLPSGAAFFAGATNNTALYTPPAVASNPGTWAAGPTFPNDSNGRSVGCKDSPSCLMTNGKVLVSAGPVDGLVNDYLSPTYFFEYDGTALNRVADPANATGVPYIGRMLLLPTGQILYAAQTNAIYAYSYYSCPDSAWRPQITSSPQSVLPGLSYSLDGRQLNGLSQAVGYGDDVAAATNYPLVRIRHLGTGRVTYCRTYDHSTMAVATGSNIESTQFRVPWSTPIGASELCVIANGISSPCVALNVMRWWRRPWWEAEIWQLLIGSLADGPLWVLGPNGPIPVDPWGPRFKAAANVARKQVLQGLRTLEKLGQEVFRKRERIANAAPLAPDDDSEEEVEAKAKRARRSKRRRK